jgi:hypothetical protein
MYIQNSDETLLECCKIMAVLVLLCGCENWTVTEGDRTVGTAVIRFVRSVRQVHLQNFFYLGAEGGGGAHPKAICSLCLILNTVIMFLICTPHTLL